MGKTHKKLLRDPERVDRWSWHASHKIKYKNRDVYNQWGFKMEKLYLSLELDDELRNQFEESKKHLGSKTNEEFVQFLIKYFYKSEVEWFGFKEE